MSPGRGTTEPLLPLSPDLLRAGADWVETGRPQRLIRWLERRLVGVEQVPAFGEPTTWWEILEVFTRWREERPSEWPESLDRLVSGLLKNALRFSRTDGSPVFEPEDAPSGRGELVRRWVGWLEDPALGTLSRWWFPARGRSARVDQESGPPLPAVSAERMVLAMLRADWSDQGDFLAVNQPDGLSSSRVELRAGGRWLIGPDWTLPDRSGPWTSPRRVVWTTDSRADALEWSVRADGSRITRTAVLMRGARVALLAEQRPATGLRTTACLPLSAEVSASLAQDGSSGILKSPGMKAQILPLVLAREEPGQAAGRLWLDGRQLLLDVASSGKRVWIAWLIVWDVARTRRTPVIRPLTVTSRTVRCAADEAQAYRIGWGSGQDSLVVYRSLTRPDLRTFLGQQTNARFLMGQFDSSGTLHPRLTFAC